jgi:hypothetical protein
LEFFATSVPPPDLLVFPSPAIQFDGLVPRIESGNGIFRLTPSSSANTSAQKKAAATGTILSVADPRWTMFSS